MSATTSAPYGGPVLRSLGAGGRWLIFLFRYTLYAAYQFLAFAGKPGSRVIVPALAAAGAYVWRLPLDVIIQRRVLAVNWRHLPEPVTMEAAGAAGVVLAICVYVVVAPHVSREGSAASGLIRFFARVALLTALIGGIAYAAGYRLPANFMKQVAPWMDWQPTLADGVLIPALIAAAFVYAVASRVLALVLGAFPVVTRPLRPLKPLKATRSVRKPARLSLAVPQMR